MPQLLGFPVVNSVFQGPLLLRRDCHHARHVTLELTCPIPEQPSASGVARERMVSNWAQLSAPRVLPVVLIRAAAPLNVLYAAKELIQSPELPVVQQRVRKLLPHWRDKSIRIGCAQANDVSGE